MTSQPEATNPKPKYTLEIVAQGPGYCHARLVNPDVPRIETGWHNPTTTFTVDFSTDGKEGGAS